MTGTYKFLFQKLCRDKVKDIFLQKGVTLFCESLRKGAHLKALKLKALEEADEIYNAKTLDELKEEIADLQEVLASLIRASGFSQKEIAETGDKKREKFGSFDAGLYVESILLPQSHPDLDYYRMYPEKYPEQGN